MSGLDERRESGEDVVHATPHGPERILDRGARRWPFWVERYAENEVEVVCAFRFRGEVTGVPAPEFVAVFKSADAQCAAEVAEANVDVPGRLIDLTAHGSLSQRDAQVRRAVLVHSGQAVKEPQRVGLCCLPSVVGLYVLDDGLRAALNADDLVVAGSGTALDSSSEGVALIEDREFRGLLIGGRITTELPSKVIQDRAQVVQRVSDDGRPGERGGLIVNPAAQDLVSRLVVVLDDCAIRFWFLVSEGIDQRVDCFQVSVCAPEPKVDCS